MLFGFISALILMWLLRSRIGTLIAITLIAIPIAFFIWLFWEVPYSGWMWSFAILIGLGGGAWQSRGEQ